MKSYTDLKQSKKLAEFLPLESADMWWSRCTITDFGDGALKVSYAVEPCNISQFRNTREDIPCWGLAALMDIIPEGQVNRMTSNGKWMAVSWPPEHYYIAKDYDSAVDACYALILGLHEQNIL